VYSTTHHRLPHPLRTATTTATAAEMPGVCSDLTLLRLPLAACSIAGYRSASSGLSTALHSLPRTELRLFLASTFGQNAFQNA